MNAKHVFHTIGAGLATGALGWIGSHLSGGVPTNLQGAEAFAAGAALGGLVYVIGLFQPVPGSPQAIAQQVALNAVEAEAAKITKGSGS